VSFFACQLVCTLGVVMDLWPICYLGDIFGILTILRLGWGASNHVARDRLLMMVVVLYRFVIRACLSFVLCYAATAIGVCTYVYRQRRTHPTNGVPRVELTDGHATVQNSPGSDGPFDLDRIVLFLFERITITKTMVGALVVYGLREWITRRSLASSWNIAGLLGWLCFYVMTSTPLSTVVARISSPSNRAIMDAANRPLLLPGIDNRSIVVRAPLRTQPTLSH